MPSIPGGLAQIMSMQQHQKLRWLKRCLHMAEKRKHGFERNMLPAMSTTISSWETLWNMGTKALIQDKKSDTC